MILSSKTARIKLSTRNFYLLKRIKQSFTRNSSFAFILISILFSSCSPNPETFIEHINGYWEIDEVQLQNGSKHDYNYNDTIDYFIITDSLTGFRKKLKPNFMGTFETSKNSESFSIKLENDSLNIYYKTPYANWKETILLATQDQLKVINKNKDVYLYKRYQPLNLESLKNN